MAQTSRRTAGRTARRQPTVPTLDTKERLVDAAGGLFTRQGLHATGIKQVLDEADARFSSLYHHFPGGKHELAAAVIARSGRDYRRLVEGIWDAQPDVVSGVREVFEGAADVLEISDYAGACPVATLALEVAGTDEELRLATADVFDAWVGSAATRLARAGASLDDARTVAHAVVALLEGAFILCRATRSTEPMRDAAGVAAQLVRRAVPRGSAR